MARERDAGHNHLTATCNGFPYDGDALLAYNQKAKPPPPPGDDPLSVGTGHQPRGQTGRCLSWPLRTAVVLLFQHR